MAEENPTPPDDDQDDGTRFGPCLDGPLSGQLLTSRYPKGVLLCDRPAGQAWLYDWCGDAFRSRSGADPLPLIEDPDAADNRWRAAEEGDYDVVAAPWAGGDPDAVDAYEGDNTDEPGGEG